MLVEASCVCNIVVKGERRTEVQISVGGIGERRKARRTLVKKIAI